MQTRSPPLDGVRLNAATFNFKIFADILQVINGDRASNRGGIIRLYAEWTYCAAHQK